MQVAEEHDVAADLAASQQQSFAATRPVEIEASPRSEGCQVARRSAAEPIPPAELWGRLLASI